ncbi:MAG: type 4a pilus biogenesis protein PilO [Gammaproteobacteria bacterium]
MKLSDLQNLDFQNVGGWPLPVKIFFMLLLLVGIQFAGYYFDVKNQRVTLEQEQKKETTHLATIEEKQEKAANLEPLKLQMKEMQQSFGDMLKQLPSRTEVAGLLVDISQTGLAAGLEFQLFKPANEVPSEYYAELPIQIRVVGNYHEFGEFISGIAALPRIVTTHNISIATGGKKTGAGKKGEEQAGEQPALVMTATAKTYRALDEEEYAAEEKKAAQAKKAQGGKKK